MTTTTNRKTAKKKAVKKPKVQNISLTKFEQYAFDAAKAINMDPEKVLHVQTSFSKFSNAEGADKITFGVHYFLENNINYYGSSNTPEGAIQMAIDSYLLATKKAVINPQTAIALTPTSDKETGLQVEVLDGFITVGAKSLNALNKKFADLTKITTAEALQYINEIVKAASKTWLQQ